MDSPGVHAVVWCRLLPKSSAAGRKHTRFGVRKSPPDTLPCHVRAVRKRDTTPEEKAMRRAAVAVLFAPALLAGCASTTPTSEGMIPAYTVRGLRGPVHPEPVAIEVKDTRQIPDPAFRQALADAVTLSQVF